MHREIAEFALECETGDSDHTMVVYVAHEGSRKITDVICPKWEVTPFWHRGGRMKTLTALVMLVGLTASAQTPAMQGASVDFETLMGMHSLGEKTVMQAFNGGACQVTPISDLPVAVRSIFGQPVSSIFVGQSELAAHFIASDIDKSYFSNGKVVVSVCSHLKTGAELDAMRKAAEKHGVPNASHLSWVWETLSFDQSTHEETVLSRFYLDEHGLLLKALGELFPGLPALMTIPANSPNFQQDIANFLASHRPPVQSAEVEHPTAIATQ
jgi:hypothetical protein